MARLARLSIAGQPHHIVLRGTPGTLVFRAPDDYRFFLQCLRDAAVRRSVAIHAYVLMPDHVHLLATPATSMAIGRMIQSVGRRYVRWFNARYVRKGTIWAGRYRSSVIEAEHYLLACSRYIEANPVRAKLVSDASNFPWSSIRHHFGLAIDPVVTDHPSFWALGNTPFERQSAYRDFAENLDEKGVVEELRAGARGGQPIGSAEFLLELAKVCKRPLLRKPRGRPRLAESPMKTPVD
jgi:putative transposase